MGQQYQPRKGASLIMEKLDLFHFASNKDAFSSRVDNLAPAHPEPRGRGGEGTLPGLGRPTVTLRGSSKLLQTRFCPILEEEEVRGQLHTAGK